MSTFLARIRERARRANAKRAKRLGQAQRTPASQPAALLEAATELDVELADLEQAAQEVELLAGAVDELGAPEAAREVELEERAPVEITTVEPTSAESEEPAPPAEAEPDASHAVIRLEFSKSSNLRAAELGADGVVAVEFRDGTITRYANFTIEEMAEWESAKSAGSWFHNNVRQKPDRHPIVEG